MPADFLRGMHLRQDPNPWRKLEQTGWLIRMPPSSTSTLHCGVEAQLLAVAALVLQPHVA